MDEQNQEQQKLAYENYVYKQQLGMLEKEMEKITMTMLDLSRASKTISSLEKINSLVPIGGNAFIEADVSSDKIFLPIGGGYLLKLNKESAETEVNRRIDSTKKVMERLQKEYESIAGKLTELSTRMRGMQ